MFNLIVASLLCFAAGLMFSCYMFAPKDEIFARYLFLTLLGVSIFLALMNLSFVIEWL